MKQLGNLAVVCAGRPDVLMQLYEGVVSVHIGTGPYRSSVSAKWDDDRAIEAIVHELNFGRYAGERKEKQAV